MDSCLLVSSQARHSLIDRRLKRPSMIASVSCFDSDDVPLEGTSPGSSCDFSPVWAGLPVHSAIAESSEPNSKLFALVQKLNHACVMRLTTLVTQPHPLGLAAPKRKECGLLALIPIQLLLQCMSTTHPVAMYTCFVL